MQNLWPIYLYCNALLKWTLYTHKTHAPPVAILKSVFETCRVKMYLQNISRQLWHWLVYHIATDKRGYPHNIFLISPLHENICCGYSLEAPHRGASNEYHNICFRGEIRKISAFFWWKKCLICYYATIMHPYNPTRAFAICLQKHWILLKCINPYQIVQFHWLIWIHIIDSDQTFSHTEKHKSREWERLAYPSLYMKFPVHIPEWCFPVYFQLIVTFFLKLKKQTYFATSYCTLDFLLVVLLTRITCMFEQDSFSL